MRRPGRELAPLPLLLALALPGPAPAQTEEARITYLTSSTAYVDAGTERGLRKGSPVTVVRDGVVVARLEVTALSSHRASCARPDGVELVVGDRVTFAPVAESTASSPRAAPAPAPSRGSRPRALRGRVGFRVLAFADRSAAGGSYTQPGLDLRLEGTSWLDQIDVSADVRTRRTWYRAGAGGSDRQEGRTRVYALLGRWRPGGGGFAVTVGRQVSDALASVSIFDGVSAGWTSSRWTGGVFGGTQPDLEDFGWSDRIREYGGWIGWRRGITAGFVASRDAGTLDREYFVLQGRLRGDRVFAHVTQEIDLNRGWRRESASLLSPTSTLLTVRWDVRDAVSLDAGFDSRRTVRRYRDRETPETDFDESVRRGAWGGIRVRPLRHTWIGANYRRSAGGSAGAADAATVTLRTSWPALRGADLALRSTRYGNARLEGWLHSVTAGGPLGSRLRAGLTVGTRNESDTELGGGRNDVFWTGVDFDLRLAGGWYALASAERSRGDVEENTHLHLSVVRRF